jgi:outer membrane protein TolC
MIILNGTKHKAFEEKMMNRKYIVLLLFFWAVVDSSNSFSQTKMTLTLQNSIEIALKQNPEIKMAEKELSKAQSDIGVAYSNILPKLDGSVNLQHNWIVQESTIPNFIKAMMGPAAPPGMPDYVRIAFGLENTMTYGATVSQPLYLGGAGIAGIRAATALKRAMEQNLEVKHQDLIFRTVNAFYTCLLTKELIFVQEEALAQAKANLDVVSKKTDAGTASGFDKMRARVEVANLQPAVISAKNSLQIALTQLRTILGLNRDSQIEVSGEFIYTQDMFDTMSLKELQDLAMQNRPELRALTEQKTATEKGISIAQSEFKPKLFFSSDYSFLAMRNNLKFGQNDFSKGFTSGFSLQIPLFNGFRSAKQYQKAQMDYKIIIDSQKQANDGILAEAEVAYNKFIEAKEKLLSANETIALAKESLRLANLMYDEGTNTQVDVLSAQLAVTQAQMNYVTSLYEYQVARYGLRKATGQLKGIL